MVAKNKNQRFAAINKEIITALEQMNLERYPKNYFVFSDDMKPGTRELKGGAFSRRWDRMRKRIKLPVEMQLYSLRDTGMHDMLKCGIDNLSVMQHADHSSLEMTTLYANHYDKQLNETIYSKSPKF
jgi:integrase